MRLTICKPFALQLDIFDFWVHFSTSVDPTSNWSVFNLFMIVRRYPDISTKLWFCLWASKTSLHQPNCGFAFEHLKRVFINQWFCLRACETIIVLDYFNHYSSIALNDSVDLFCFLTWGPCSLRRADVKDRVRTASPCDMIYVVAASIVCGTNILWAIEFWFKEWCAGARTQTL